MLLSAGFNLIAPQEITEVQWSSVAPIMLVSQEGASHKSARRFVYSLTVRNIHCFPHSEQSNEVINVCSIALCVIWARKPSCI